MLGESLSCVFDDLTAGYRDLAPHEVLGHVRDAVVGPSNRPSVSFPPPQYTNPGSLAWNATDWVGNSSS